MSADNSGVKAEFDRAAKTYDSVRRLMIPCFDDFYGTVARMMPFERDDAFDVLDLGAGTGLLTAVLREQFPKARYQLIDISDEMLARARDRFAGEEGVRIAVSDYSIEALPGRFDAIVSALSIHHLDDPGKAALFRRIYDALRPGGIFVNAEEVLAPTWSSTSCTGTSGNGWRERRERRRRSSRGWRIVPNMTSLRSLMSSSSGCARPGSRTWIATTST